MEPVGRASLRAAMEFNWRPGIGDPTVGGWLTVALYILAVVLCWKASFERQAAQSESHIWRFLAVLFLALGINKQLDLQSAFTELGHMIAVNGGWYGRRHTVQVDFIMGAAALCGIAGAALLVWARRAAAPCKLAILGTAVVFGFVLIRAASFHRVDLLINNTVFGLRWNWIVEIGGILIVIAAATWTMKMGDRTRPKAGPYFR